MICNGCKTRGKIISEDNITRTRSKCGVVWCGVVWCGVVWCGVVWCGVCGVVWCVCVCVCVCVCELLTLNGFHNVCLSVGFH